MSRTGALRALGVLALIIGGLAVTSSPAGADVTSFNCDASALRVTLLGQTTIEPVTANRGQAQCLDASSSLGALPTPLAATLANAVTAISSDGQTANATGGVGNLSVSPAGLASLQAALVNAVQTAQSAAAPAINAIAPISISVSSLGLSPQLLALLPLGTTTITVDIRPALDALLNAIGSTNSNLVDLTLATAYAKAQCASNQPQLTGSAQLAALSVLGQPIPTNAASTQAINVLNTQSISPSSIDLSKIVISPQITDPSLLSVVDSALTPLLAQIPPISIPAQLAQISVTPDQETRTADSLTEDALHLSVSLLGQSLIDAGFGEARVSNSSVNCAPPPSPVQAAALQCTTRKLTLINVVQHGNHVALLGAADRSLIGQRVSIYYLVGHRLVATPVVGPDGTFTAQGPLPPRSQRFTNLARYQAVDRAGEKSLDLKLHRRMVVDSMRVVGGQVVISGRVIGPLTHPVAPILIQRRVSCTQLVTVKRIKPNADGTFKVSLTPPPNTQAAVYRAATQVQKVVTNPKQFPTFTLPRVVEIA